VQVRFWGTRGSIASPGRATVRYGGNTSCVEVRTTGGELVIFDSGTGIRELGQALSDGNGAVRGHIFLSHTHWDHIQGFPFFWPAFVEGNDLTIYAGRDLDRELESVLAGQMEYAYFPVRLEDMHAAVRFRNLGEEQLTVGDARIDVRMDDSGRIYVLEANPNPNLAYGEDFAESGEVRGISYERLLDRIVALGLRWEPERTG